MKNSAADSLEITVIVSTYNRPDALDLVLCALGEQDYLNFEIIIADDGSDETTAALVASMKSIAAVSYITYGRLMKDSAWRRFTTKEFLRQRVNTSSFSMAIAFRSNFLSQHAALGKIKLSQAYTDEVLANRVALQRLAFKDWVWMRLTGRANRFLYFFSLPDGPWRHYRPRSSKRLYGCNMAVWTEDLKAVGGFDERYQGWGSDDRDLVARLINAGIYRKDGHPPALVAPICGSKPRGP